jgi:hypothetical protein
MERRRRESWATEGLEVGLAGGGRSSRWRVARRTCRSSAATWGQSRYYGAQRVMWVRQVWRGERSRRILSCLARGRDTRGATQPEGEAPQEGVSTSSKPRGVPAAISPSERRVIPKAEGAADPVAADRVSAAHLDRG